MAVLEKTQALDTELAVLLATEDKVAAAVAALTEEVTQEGAVEEMPPTTARTVAPHRIRIQHRVAVTVALEASSQAAAVAAVLQVEDKAETVALEE